jgi:hypothetical protein
MLWKNFAQNENNTENARVFANVEKIFWRRGKLFFKRTGRTSKTGWIPALRSATEAVFAFLGRTLFFFSVGVNYEVLDGFKKILVGGGERVENEP